MTSIQIWQLNVLREYIIFFKFNSLTRIIYNQLISFNEVSGTAQIQIREPPTVFFAASLRKVQTFDSNEALRRQRFETRFERKLSGTKKIVSWCIKLTCDKLTIDQTIWLQYYCMLDLKINILRREGARHTNHRSQLLRRACYFFSKNKTWHSKSLKSI